ncbi:hypothetical protein HDU98_005578 [Podochytrium sp. JEL0797]|nr:hypothetical protein HDU98_005578 [Podochytrium sp. JEL0797]
MQFLTALFPLAAILSCTAALPSPQTPVAAAIGQIQQAQAASTDTTGATQANLQAQINALAAMPNTYTGSPYWGASYNPYMGTSYNGWTPAQNALTAQIQAMQQQMVGMTDPAAVAAMQNQIMALQSQIGASGMAPGMMMPAGVMPGGMAMPVAQQQNAALMAQIQAMQQQMAMMGSNPAAQQAMAQQIAAVQQQMV